MRHGHYVIDAHNHVIEGGIDTTFSEPSGKANRSPEMTTETLIRRMEYYGIDKSVLIAHAWSNTPIEGIRHEHDLVMSKIKVDPDRFLGVATADARHKQAGVDEAKRAIEELGFRGLKLLPSFHNYIVDSKIVDPLMRLASDYKMPVLYCSQWHYYGAEPWRWARLARRHPELTFVMCHMGIDPFVTESLVVPHMVQDLPNMVIDTSATTTDPEGVIKVPVEMLGADHVMWASDSGGFLHPGVELLKVDLVDLTPEQKRQVLGGTAARVFGIPYPQVPEA